jgi:hypothetical protein
MTSARKCFTVALIGPDGVGKTTISKQLEAAAALRIKYLYMGDNVQASNYTLPTTRWWKTRRKRQRDLAGAAAHGGGDVARAPAAASAPAALPAAPRRRGPVATAVRPVRKTLGFLNRILEESYRQAIAASFVRRGFIVLFDRHFLLDYYHTDVVGARAQQSFKHRMHGWFLRRITPPPDLVICLDAPGEVVWARKHELTPAILEERRAQYRSLGSILPHFTVVDANRPLEPVVSEVQSAIERFQGGGDAAR